AESQPRHAADRESASPFRLVVQEAEVREAREKCPDRNLSLEARERGAQAEMNPVAKCDVVRRIAGHLEAVRVGILLWVTVGGGQDTNDDLAAADVGVAEANLLPRCPPGRVYRARVAQHLVDRGRKELRLF